MTDQRLIYRMEDGYAEALGVAMYMFARLEWNVVWCCERLDKGSVSELQELTAGIIRKRLGKLITSVVEDGLREQLMKASEVFNPLVDLRNDMIHGTPITDKQFGQCLKGKTGPWSIGRINQAADSFADCAILFNSLLHGALKEPA